ncbi:basic salivary proline-rich protein 2 [Nomascus leucogenys]|uniref:basic salivary proline-rich protein 2 n=1 Tax=Nomascus leucogenys TaxID=61853 RepID=UPI00122D97B6|nr:basic salivary proline-rich protein 2 [Nomascus leucogenys]
MQVPVPTGERRNQWALPPPGAGSVPAGGWSRPLAPGRCDSQGRGPSRRAAGGGSSAALLPRWGALRPPRAAPTPRPRPRKASVHLPAPLSRSPLPPPRRSPTLAGEPPPAHRPLRVNPRHGPRPLMGDRGPATQVGVAHAPPGFEHLCPRKLISAKARPTQPPSLNVNTRVTWPQAEDRVGAPCSELCHPSLCVVFGELPCEKG